MAVCPGVSGSHQGAGIPPEHQAVRRNSCLHKSIRLRCARKGLWRPKSRHGTDHSRGGIAAEPGKSHGFCAMGLVSRMGCKGRDQGLGVEKACEPSGWDCDPAGRGRVASRCGLVRWSVSRVRPANRSARLASWMRLSSGTRSVRHMGRAGWRWGRAGALPPCALRIPPRYLGNIESDGAGRVASVISGLTDPGRSGIVIWIGTRKPGR